MQPGSSAAFKFKRGEPLLRSKPRETARRLLKRQRHHRNILSEKWKESFASVLPIALIVMVLCFLWVPAPISAMMSFLIGAAMLVVGMGLFTLGTDLAMTPIGEHVGSAVTRSKKLWLIVLVGFLVGLIVTISEPDLTVLAQQVPGVPNMTLILSVAIGVGIFLVVALLRILFRIRMSWLLLGCYIAVFALAQFVPKSFLALSFDAGGVTTGPMTATFLLPMAMGACAAVGGDVTTDAFGLVAMVAMTPLITMQILGLIFFIRQKRKKANEPAVIRPAEEIIE